MQMTLPPTKFERTWSLPKVKTRGWDPFSAGKAAYMRGAPFDPDFGRKCRGWSPISAQCLYERGRLAAAENTSRAI